MSTALLYHSGTEDELDPSPQPSKRRKVTLTPSCRDKPLTSRVQSSVKPAVHGKPPIPQGIISGLETTPTKLATKRRAPNEHISLWPDEPDELGDEANLAVMATPTKPPPSNHWRTATKVQVVTGAGTVGNTTKASEQALSRKRGKKYRGWEYLKEGEDVGINNQDAFAKIAEEAAKEAAKAPVDSENSTIASTKGLRERKPRVSSTPIRLQENRTESIDSTRQTKKRLYEEKPSSKKKGKKGDDRGSFRAHRPPMRSTSLDELHDGPLLGQEVTAVHLRTPKEKHSTSQKKDNLSVTNFEKNDVPNSPPDPLGHLHSVGFSPRRGLSKEILPKHLATQQPADTTHTTALQPEAWTADSQEELLKAATRVESYFSRYPTALTVIKRKILLQLTGKVRLPILPHLSRDYDAVHQLLSQTVQAGEGNSILLTGSRGTGKTTVVESAIFDIIQSNGDDFYVVRLNGFIHTDDKLALREIWRQLGRELEGDDDETSLRNNYADTLTSLLALLSHQDESREEGGVQKLAAKSVIFVLDEFDLFAQHPRQTLLYNLFDVAQSHRNAPIAVLGLTTKVHVVESLEKRVKSRFSQRSVNLSLPKSFQVFQDVCLEALKYHNPSAAGASSFKARLQRHGSKDQPPATVNPSDTVYLPEDLVEAWNAYAHALLSTGHLTELLHSYYVTSKRPTDFQTAIALPLVYALTRSNLSSITTSPPYTALAAPDSTLALLPSLSTLQLSLLIAACRLEIILSTDTCSFAMAYEEYLGMIKKSKVQSSTSGQLASGMGSGARGHDVAAGAWQGLEDVGLLVVPATGAGGGRSGGKDRDDGRWRRVDVSLEELGAWLEGEGRGVSGSQGLMKWCREI